MTGVDAPPGPGARPAYRDQLHAAAAVATAMRWLVSRAQRSAQAVRCRPGTVPHSGSVTVPDQRRTVPLSSHAAPRPGHGGGASRVRRVQRDARAVPRHDPPQRQGRALRRRARAGAGGARRPDRGDRALGGRSARSPGPATRVIDLGGRTVIPGLIDSHIHAIRAGLTWQTEVHWIGVRSLAAGARPPPRSRQIGAEGLLAGGRRRLDRAAVRGGPPPDPGRDRRRRARPSRLCAAALQPRAARPRRLRGARHRRRCGPCRRGSPSSATREGRPTGWLTGDNRTISDLFDLLPRPDFAQKIAGTRAFFRDAQQPSASPA